MNTYKLVKLIANKVGSAWIVSGFDTFAVKETIKSLGGKWDPLAKTWSIVAEDISVLDAAAKELSETRVAAKKYAASPEGRAATYKAQFEAALALKATGAYHWICCDKCVVVDWGRQHTTCDACAVNCGPYKNSFRVRGMIYTGD